MAENPLVQVQSALPALRTVGRVARRVLARAAAFDQLRWEGVAYGDHDLSLRVWEPDNLAPRDGWPAILMLHGGGWVEGGPEQFEVLAPRLCRRGMVVAAARYRLGAAGRWPNQLDDVLLAVDRVLAMQIDPTRLALWGHSAGGQLALMAGLTRPQAFCGVVAVGAPTDLRRLDEVQEPRMGEVFDAETRGAASPLLAPGPLPPTLLLHGAADRVVPVDHARQLQARFPDTIGLVEVPDGDHGLRWPPRKAARALGAAIDQVVAWQAPAPRGSKWRRSKRGKKKA